MFDVTHINSVTTDIYNKFLTKKKIKKYTEHSATIQENLILPYL